MYGITTRLYHSMITFDLLVTSHKAVGSGEAGEALASPVFRHNSNISVLTFLILQS